MKYNFSYKLNGKTVTETAEKLSDIIAKLFKLESQGNKIGSLRFKHIGVNHAIA